MFNLDEMLVTKSDNQVKKMLCYRIQVIAECFDFYSQYDINMMAELSNNKQKLIKQALKKEKEAKDWLKAASVCFSASKWNELVGCGNLELCGYETLNS